jgi:CopA family copper-resistance protein
MTVVASDGQNVQPVIIDEFRIGVAETYDVIVEPKMEDAYCIFVQSIDRSGYTVGNFTSDEMFTAKIPDMDPMPILGHGDMGMNMEGMDHSKMAMGSDSMSGMEGMDHSKMAMGSGSMAGMEGMDHSKMAMGSGSMAGMEGMDHSQPSMVMPTLGLAGYGSDNEIKHLDSENGPQVDMQSGMPQSGLNDPGIGLRDHQANYNRKVLTYADLKGLHPTHDKRQPTREIQLHLAGNMNRFMWSINGINFADSAPLELAYNERVRITLVNDTMMIHPMHLHGVWSELETGDPDYIPRKHTVMVQPGSKISYLVTADALGQWAYHCHLLYHMPGMFRKVVIK